MRDEAWEILPSSKLGLYGEGGEVSGQGENVGLLYGKVCEVAEGEKFFSAVVGPRTERKSKRSQEGVPRRHQGPSSSHVITSEINKGIGGLASKN